jgi:hypothetical protein
MTSVLDHLYLQTLPKDAHEESPITNIYDVEYDDLGTEYYEYYSKGKHHHKKNLPSKYGGTVKSKQEEME